MEYFDDQSKTPVVSVRISMTNTLLAAALLAGLPLAASAQDPKVAAGQKVYTNQKCALCHSVAGKGNPKGALDGVGSRLGADDIRLWIADAKTMTINTKAERKPEMRSYTLSPDEIGALVAYMQSLKK